MADVFLVQVRDCRKYLPHYYRRLRLRQKLLLHDQVKQLPSLTHLCHQIYRLLRFVHLVQLQYVRMVQLLQELHFGGKHFLILHVFLRNGFDGPSLAYFRGVLLVTLCWAKKTTP